MGTIVRDGQRFALIQLGPQKTGKIEYLAVGDNMPDGSKLDEVTNDSIATAQSVSGDAQRTVYRLFDKKL